jgi:predicted membrane protein
MIMPLIYVFLALVGVGLAWWLLNTYRPFGGNYRSILNVVLGLIVVGMALWLINNYIPMAGSIKTILNVVVVIATCVGVLQAVGLWSQIVNLWTDLRNHRVPR